MSKYYKIIAIILLFTFVTSFLLYPLEAQAKLKPKQFFRWVKKKVNQVVKLPGKATRWMGPVLGPIAADMLTANLTKHHKLGKIFRRLKKANKVITNIEEQKKLLSDVQTMYKDQAQQIRGQVTKLEEARDKLSKDLTRTDMTFKEYEKKVVAISNTIKAYEKAAEKFEATAGNITVKDVIKMAGKELLKQAMGQVKNAVIYEASEELKKLIDPNIIATLVSQDNIGADGLIDLLVSGDIAQILKKSEVSEGFNADELAERVRERIKQVLKENKEALKDNFKEKVNDIIQEMIDQLEEEKGKYTAGDEATKEEQSVEADNDSSDLDTLLEFDEIDNQYAEKPADIPVDEHGCKPGYDYKPNFGISCVQADCNSIPNAHWSYEGYCVCGSSGSMFDNPEDPNKECSRKATYKTCPGCVYACTWLNDECPEEK